MMTETTQTSPLAEADTTAVVGRICDEIRQRQRFVLTSHARPDGDSIGSQLAMAYALEALGKEVRLVNADAAPEHYFEFPGVDRIEIAAATTTDADAVIVMECSDLTRTGVAGLDGRFIINIDHHAGNRMYGAVNWFDESAAACGEMVFDIIRALGVPSSPRDRHAHLPGDPDRHRLVPSLQHHAAHVRHLPADGRGRRQSGDHGAAGLRQQQLRQAEADWRAARPDGARARRAARRAAHGRHGAGGVRLHQQRHRGAHQPAAHRARDPGGGVLRRRARRRCGSACGRSTTSTYGWSRTSSAAAATRTPPDSPCQGRSPTSGDALSSDWSGPSTRACGPVRLNERRPGRRQAVGPTSHDVVGRVRRILATRRIGHTGTLDPLATGVLPLVIGCATRLAQFLSADDKEYVADIRFGFATATYDALGAAVPEPAIGRRPASCVLLICAASNRRCRSSAAPIWQLPPAFSAKKIAGTPAYELARRRTGRRSSRRWRSRCRRWSWWREGDDGARLRVACSSGFYVRSLAHETRPAAGMRRASRRAAPHAGRQVHAGRRRRARCRRGGRAAAARAAASRSSGCCRSSPPWC